MIFEIKQLKERKLKLIYKKAMRELDSFFGLNWNRNLPSVFLIPDRKTIDLLKQKRTKDWEVGWADGQNVFLLNPKNYEKESCYKYSNKEYEALLKHELCHLFFNGLSKRKYEPIWLNEGIAIYLSGQNEFEKRPKKFKEFLKFYSKMGNGVYLEAGFAVEILNKKFGKNKLVNLIKNLPKIKNKKEFELLFKEIYKFLPSYKKFNELG